jgi:hypothetical protein
MKSNWDKYLDPPDEPEIPICESCGKDMEEFWANPLTDDVDYSCTNPFCPDKHTGIAKEMAEKIADLEEIVADLRLKLSRLGALEATKSRNMGMM